MMSLLFHPYFVQGLGLISFAMGVFAFLCKDDDKLKIILGMSSLVMAVHFVLLGAYMGAGAAAISGARGFLSARKGAEKWAPFFFALYVPLAFFSINDVIDWLPWLSGVLATYAMFYLVGVRLRFVFCICIALWLVHNIVHGSVGGILKEIFYMVMNLRTMWALFHEEKTRRIRTPEV